MYSAGVDAWAFGCLICDICGGKSPCFGLGKENDESCKNWYGRVVVKLIAYTGACDCILFREFFKYAKSQRVCPSTSVASEFDCRLGATSISTVVQKCLVSDPDKRITAAAIASTWNRSQICSGVTGADTHPFGG